jgi:hypothetical protein
LFKAFVVSELLCVLCVLCGSATFFSSLLERQSFQRRGRNEEEKEKGRKGTPVNPLSWFPSRRFLFLCDLGVWLLRDNRPIDLTSYV